MAKWYAVSTGSGFVVGKTSRPAGGRYAFGPYRSKKKACEVGCYQGQARTPRGCPVNACAHPTFSGARRRRKR